MAPKQIRQPIITVCGHVDHGKTSLLDRIRKSSVQESEAGGITQKISFTLYPLEMLKKAFPQVHEIRLDFPGFLFIDTPGHAAFTNLRKRGGSLADLAILVIDINEGIKPQTAEVIQILKLNKTPFIIALNKIDNISGWRTAKSKEIKESIESQPSHIRQLFDEKYLTLSAALNSFGFDADLFYNISDFTKKIALVPCSAKTGEGISELILVLCGLSQKYLKNRLMLGDKAKGVVLEIKKEKEMNYAEAILYDGELEKKDEIAVSDLNGKAIATKIRLLEEIFPLSSRFSAKEKVRAATGLRLQLIEKAEILPGMPFVEFGGSREKEEIEKTFRKEISENIQTDKFGIIAKADSLGSLEALLLLLKQAGIPVVKAGIGKISKADVISAKANLEINEVDAVIAGFNVSIDEDAKILLNENVKVLTNEVIYKLIEELAEFRTEKEKEIEKKRMLALASLCKIKILPQYVFRNTNPAIFGVKVEAGKLRTGINLVDKNGERAGRIKNVQHEKQSVEEATEGMEVAVSIPGTNFERKLKDMIFLYSDISETGFRNFKKNKDLLSSSEISALQEIATIKRKENPNWGM